MHVRVFTAALPGEGHERAISDTAANMVRMSFNPSTLCRVDAIKALAAGLISEIEALREDDAYDAREAAIAITKVQEASMFAVASATSTLV